ncbi:MAG TPA: tyrosine-type recombinase/integrase [Dissulfurispiraceae bacterium]|nr:tyrosine-type recombinase/integrase [Dissulfurispiraceae bacterium]
MLDYLDGDGKRRRISLAHADRRKADKQKAQKERELRMGIVAPQSMTLSEFVTDSLTRTGDQIRESTRTEYASAMAHLIQVVGDLDYQNISHKHAEQFLQARLDAGDSPATAAKKIRHLKRFFQLAVDRGQLDQNPLARIRQPKTPKTKVRVYSVDECDRMLRASLEVRDCWVVQWDLLIAFALVTGMRKSEMLNLVWGDIDFGAGVVEVQPKTKSAATWEWRVKDTDRRTLGLTDAVLSQLTDLQARCPEGYPYVLVPPDRYDHIQERRAAGKWTYSDSRLKVINNFRPQFNAIRERAGIAHGRFHDLRSTALTNWFAMGLKEYEVMRLAGHSKFETTHRFYLAVADDLVDRARHASDAALGQVLARAPQSARKRRRLPSTSA